MDADADQDLVVRAGALVDAGEKLLGVHGIHRACEIHQVGIPDVLLFEAPPIVAPPCVFTAASAAQR